jgi:hypothetical protein
VNPENNNEKKSNKKKEKKENKPKIWCGGNNFIMLTLTCQVHTHLLTPPRYPPPIQFTLL